jgi:hypothetical protein
MVDIDIKETIHLQQDFAAFLPDNASRNIEIINIVILIIIIIIPKTNICVRKQAKLTNITLFDRQTFELREDTFMNTSK